MYRYILHSTMIMVFSESLVIYDFYAGLDLKFFYLIMPINLVLFFFYEKKIFVQKNIFLIFFYLTISAIFSTGLLKGMFQVIGISISVIYFYTILRYLSSIDYKKIIETYLEYSYWVCIIGFTLYFYFAFFLNNKGLRFHSILEEPAHFAGIILPAFFIMLRNIAVYKIRFIVIFTSLLLSFSSIGYVGMLVGFSIYSDSKITLRNFILLFIILLISYGSYNFIPEIKLRVDDTLSSVSTLDIEGVNLSTYALVSNMFVAVNSFKENPVFGSGIGSHPVSHEKYIKLLPGYDQFSGPIRLRYLNSEDANSLFLRVLSELGILGVIAVFLFIIKFYSSFNEYGIIISKGILLYFVYKLIREGNYFPPEMYFFVFLYYFNRYRD